MIEINKKKWSRFCESLSTSYCFARTEVVRVDPDCSKSLIIDGMPLINISLTRSKGRIVTFDIKFGQIRNGSPALSVVSLGAPVKILSEPSNNSIPEVIEIHNEDDYTLIIRIYCHNIADSYNSFVGEMAYSLAEARGFLPGHDQKDWYLAERLIQRLVRLTSENAASVVSLMKTTEITGGNKLAKDTGVH